MDIDSTGLAVLRGVALVLRVDRRDKSQAVLKHVRIVLINKMQTEILQQLTRTVHLIEAVISVVLR